MQPIFQKSLGSHLALIAEMPTLPISPGGSRNFTPTPGLTVTYIILPEFMFFDVIVTFFVFVLIYIMASCFPPNSMHDSIYTATMFVCLFVLSNCQFGEGHLCSDHFNNALITSTSFDMGIILFKYTIFKLACMQCLKVAYFS